MSGQQDPGATPPANEDPKNQEPPKTGSPGGSASKLNNDSDISHLPSDVQDYIKSLRAEGMSRRDKLDAEKTRASAVEKELNELKSKLESETKAAEKKKLEEQGEHKRLAELAEQERDATKQKYQSRIISTELKAALATAGVLDLDVADLVPRDKIVFDKDDNVTGIAEAVEAFKAAKPHLFKPDAPATPPPVASGSSKTPPSPDAKGNITAAVLDPDLKRADYERMRREAISRL